jgi:sugar lactone lactonase YvrE
MGPSGDLFVSSRFEGSVYRVRPDGTAQVFATELGTPCGLAFDSDGNLFAGDRSGSIFQVTPDGKARVFATLPPSVAAYHLAFGPDRSLYVTGPTLAPRDPVYRIDPSGTVETIAEGFGRPQGLSFDRHGHLYVVEALAGMSAVFRMSPDAGVGSRPEVVLSGAGLVGLAVAPEGGLVVASNDTIYRLQVPVYGPRPPVQVT